MMFKLFRAVLLCFVFLALKKWDKDVEKHNIMAPNYKSYLAIFRKICGALSKPRGRALWERFIPAEINWFFFCRKLCI